MPICSITDLHPKGANRGLGHELVKELAEHPPIKPLLILACARRPLTSSSFKTSPDAKVEWHKLDIGNKESISDFAETVKKTCPDGVDVLINNAGVNVDPTEGHGVEQAKTTIGVNYEGTASMMKTFVPLMRQPGLPELGESRIVNVSSVGGKIVWAGSDELRRSFKEASTMDQVDKLASQYLQAVESGAESNGGWPKGKSYCVSKSLINASTQVVAAEHRDLLVNCCCPGWVQTDMGGLIGTPSKTLAEGARVPLKLAFGSYKDSGRYWENPSVSGKGSGQVSDW